MKQLLTFFTAILFVTQMNSQTVPEVQQSMITKVTATWCPHCGTWGWDFYENISNDNDSKALMLKAHYSGDLQTNIGQDLANNFNSQSQPRFVVNNTDQNVTTSTASAKRTNIQQIVDDVYEQAPVVNAGVLATLDNNQVSISVKTKFFQATSGEFHTNVYIVEDGVIANQSGNSAGANTVHEDIIRTTASGTTFGALVTNGTVDAGMEFTQSYTIPVNSGWNMDNVEFVAVVWSKSGETYTFENGSAAALSTSTPVKDIAEEIQLNIQPTLVSYDTNISISLDKNQDLSIELINLQGQVVKEIHTGNLGAGQHHFNVAKADLASGIYLVSIQGNEGIASRRIVIE